jgi:hypothetical protein
MNVHLPTDRELDNFFELHPILTLFIFVLFVGGCLKFVEFVCATFFGG